MAASPAILALGEAMVEAALARHALRGPDVTIYDGEGRLANREIKAGRMLDNGGLMPLAMGAQVRIVGGELSVVDWQLMTCCVSCELLHASHPVQFDWLRSFHIESRHATISVGESP